MSRDFSDTYLGQLRKVVGSRLLQVPGMRAVILDAGGNILLQHRSDFQVWGLPGGHPEENECMEDCLRREVLEETGLTVLEFKAFGFASQPKLESITYPNGHRIHSFCLLYFVTKWRGELLGSNEESLALRFTSTSELPDMLAPEKNSLLAFSAYQKTGNFQLC